MNWDKLFLMKPAVVAAALCFQCSFCPSFGAEYSLVWPGAGSPVAKPETAEKFVTQTGFVAIPANAAAICAQMLPGDTMLLNFFGQAGDQDARSPFSYSVTVRSVTRDVNGVVSVSGTAEGQPMETVVMSAGADGFVLTLQDLEKQKTYRVVGDPRTAAATVREIDLTKMPPRYDGHDLVRPEGVEPGNAGGK